MAGIGFQLKKIISKQNYTSVLHGYLYAGLISSGPWLVTICSLGLLALVMNHLTTPENMRLFFISLSVIYGISLVLTGPLQIVLTRYVADQHFLNRPEKVFPSFVFTLAWVCGGFALLGMWLFLKGVEGPLLFRLSSALMMVMVAGNCIGSVFLTGIKDYQKVVLALMGGSILSVLAAGGFLLMFGVPGAMLGLAVGHAGMLLFLCITIYKEWGNHQVGNSEFLRYFPKYWDLALSGFLYNLGIWSDKCLYWWLDPMAQQVTGMLYTSPIYDRVVFFSFLTVVPGMAVFLLKLETSFAEKNQAFYEHALKKATLSQLQQIKGEMIASLRDGLILLLKVQGCFTAILLLNSDVILPKLGLGAVQSGVFQISLIGVFLMVFFLSLLTILHYLDKRRDAMWCCLVFMLVNSVVTSASILAGERWFGVGFFVATACALVLAAWRVNHHLANVDYDAFASQPITG